MLTDMSEEVWIWLRGNQDDIAFPGKPENPLCKRTLIRLSQ